MFAVFYVLCLVAPSVFAALPQGWKTCPRSSPDHNECIRQQIQMAMEALADGNEELKLKPLEPALLPRSHLTVTPKFDVTLFNITITGLSSAKAISVENDPWKSMKLKLHYNTTSYSFSYQAKGQLLSFPIVNTGFGTIRMDNLTRLVDVSFSEYKKGGKTYLKIKQLVLVDHPGFMFLDFSPNSGSKDYKKFINKLLNDNWQYLVEIEQQTSKGHGATEEITDYINSVFAAIPKEDFDRP